MSQQIFIGVAHRETVTGFRNVDTGAYINDAVVSWSVMDAAGTPLTSATGTMSYVAASNGNYTAVVPASVTSQMTQHAEYLLVLVFVVGGVQVDQRTVTLTAARRQLS
jgi:hypothetical protein